MSHTYRLDPSTRYTLNGGEAPLRATVPTMYGSELAPDYRDVPTATGWPCPGLRAILQPVTDAELDDLLDSLDLI